MSPAPGVLSSIGEDVIRRSIVGDTGSAFVVGVAEKGSVTEPMLITSRHKITPTIGEPVPNSALHRTLDVAFREGLDYAIVVRAVGAAHKTASKKLVDGEADTLEVLASSPGAWGNGLEVAVIAGTTGGTFHLAVSIVDELKEKSPELADNDAAVAWAAASSKLISLKSLGGGDPDVQSVTLTGGDDDADSVDAAAITEALKLFTPDLGFGQVAAPGYTAESVHAAVMAHCETHNRDHVLDGVDTDDVDALVGDGTARRALTGNRKGAGFVPWDIVSVAQGATVKVPPCARQLGRIAAVDRVTGNPNQPAAGEYGRASYVIGLTQTYSEADRERLNEAGWNVSIIDEGQVTTYGWRTFADPVTERAWLTFSGARQGLSMAAHARRVLKRYMFKQLDGDGETRGNAEGAIINEVHAPARRNKAVYDSGVTVTQEINPEDGTVGKLEATQWLQPTKYAEVIELTTVVTNDAA
jgi:hypothetical protein